MDAHRTTRRRLLGGMAGAGAAAGATLGLPRRAQAAGPITLNIIDVAGNLALSQPAFDAYRRANPAKVGRIATSQAPAPEMPAKIRAQQAAGRLDIDMVLTGTDGLAAGTAQTIWLKLLPDHASALPDLASIYLPTANQMQGLAQGNAVLTAYYPSGPLLEYNPDKVKQVPGTAAELLDWTRANKNRFLYARPANSGPGRTWLMGIPYILGDRDPTDPEHGWDKSWAYLQELGRNIEYYPAGTGALMKELGEGSRDMTVTTTGWDINPRALGIVPKSFAVAPLANFKWVVDGQYVAIPSGIAPERLAVVLDLVSYMLTRPAQAFNYDKGYFYPGPAVKDVPLSLAPQSSQDVIAEFGRPEYAKLIADTPKVLPLDADKLVYAFRRWDEQVGARAGR